MALPVCYTANGLNVLYVPSFFTKEESDGYFDQLKDLPYYVPTYKIKGKSLKPKRKMVAFGDSGSSYKFAGIEIPGEPWTPLMLQLRDHAEKYAGTTFNYVLVNYYANGRDYIAQHKDTESCLDSTFSTCVFSFGAERTLEFKKPHQESLRIVLAHGSLYKIEKPTNEHFTHGIPVESSVKGVRISLTFHHLLIDPIGLPLKKQKLQTDDDPAAPAMGVTISANTTPSVDQPSVNASPSSTSLDTNSSIEQASVNASPSLASLDTSSLCDTPSVAPPVNTSPCIDLDSLNTISSTPESPSVEQASLVPTTELSMCDDSSKNSNKDWLDTLFQEGESVSPTLLQLNVNSDVMLQVFLTKDLKLRIEISKQGKKKKIDSVILTPETWAFFQESIGKIFFRSSRESFISNNQLACICASRDFCILQQIFPLNTPGYFLKPNVLKLMSDEFFKLVQIKSTITQKLVEFQLLKLLPALILNQTPKCTHHYEYYAAKTHFLNCLLSEIREVSHHLFDCEGCVAQRNSQKDHDCIMKPVGYKFFLNREKILLNLNLRNIACNILSDCSCHFDSLFFKQFNMNFYNIYLEESL